MVEVGLELSVFLLQPPKQLRLQTSTTRPSFVEEILKQHRSQAAEQVLVIFAQIYIETEEQRKQSGKIWKRYSLAQEGTKRKNM